MNTKFKTLISVIVVLLPFISSSQVKFQKVNSTTIGNLLPFYSPALLSNAQTVTFPFTRPTIIKGGIPDTLNIDSTYFDLDDTTYEIKPKFDAGRVITANLTMASGNWQSTSVGSVWTLKIFIQNALNTGLRIGSISLSPTAKLYILNGDVNMLKGPYTREVLSSNGAMGTFPMNSSSCYLLLYEPNAANNSQNSITISGVVAGVQTLGDDISGSSARVSNGCIPSIRCFNDWMNTARAVALWTDGEGGVCTGTLLNNENFDGISYFYSAQHCLPINRANLAFAAFQFRYWQDGCNSSSDEIGIEIDGGAVLLHEVAYNDGDAILLRINRGPGVGDAVTYAGWNRQSDAPPNTLSGIIHHPRGGDMRLTQTKKVRTFLWDNDFWRTSYSSGVMLSGSSGSALLNGNQQVVGTLSRGTSSCFFKDQGDRFGKFSSGWSGMQQFLSPNQNRTSIESMSLLPLQISGNTTIDCSIGSQAFSVPNLAGCTYTWTTSPNFSIILGLNTHRVFVTYNGTNATDAGWLNVVILDSKGTVEGRRVELRVNLTKITPSSVTGFYTMSVDPTQTPLVDGSSRFVMVRRGQTVGINFSITSLSNVTGVRWSYDNFWSTSNNFTVSITAPQTGYSSVYKTINLDLTTPCGVVRNSYSFQVMSGGWSMRIAPNPAVQTLTVSLEKDASVSGNSKTSEKGNNSAEQKNSQNNETRLSLFDANSNKLVRTWLYQEATNKNYQLNISGLKPGVYILKTEREGQTLTTKVIIQ
ncbi:MAG: T9SS type A sorting domain-containing protein [Chitinophagaceae bacterium]|nr:T9SS type A sorting domain-containing protein [Chitinophagaceae bacterium]